MLGAQRLAAVAISAVVRVLAAVFIFAVAQFIVRLRVKADFAAAFFTGMLISYCLLSI